MANDKNPTALWFARMRETMNTGNPKDPNRTGTLAYLMTNFFKANYGITDLPKTVADYAIYDQLPVAANTQFFQGQWTTVRSNYPGGSFNTPQSEHMIVQGLRIFEAVQAAATIDEADWQPGATDPFLKNAAIGITINGQRVMTQLPLTVFDNNQLSATVQGATNDNRGFYWLMEPLVVLGQTAIAIDLINASGGTITPNLACRIELHGQRFIGN
jgi:hypothetical protein